ncbi:toll/interleukin-1 receptor domain-containing protein [Sinomicrobium sp. M5D2P17]
MPTLKEYFNNDFTDLSLDSDLTMTIHKSDKNIQSTETVIIKRRVRHNLDSSCRLLTFYIPERKDTLLIIGNILENIANHIEQSNDVESIGGYENDLQIGTHENIFSHRLYFYTESSLTKDEIIKLDKFCKGKKVFATIRSEEYVKTRMKKEKPLAFISHDSRNKETIAKPLAIGLSSRLCSVWYDEYSLKVGQSLRESIEDGIKNAKKCILVLTPEFLKNPGWTKKEFNSIFTREMIFNEKVVIPIWYNVTKEDVYTYSPSLADTVALIWPDSLNKSDDEYKKDMEKLISKIHTVIME